MTKRIGATGFAAAVFFAGVLALVAFFVAWAPASVASTVAAATVSSAMARRARRSTKSERHDGSLRRWWVADPALCESAGSGYQ